jgi:hypothetical protein
VTAESPQKGGLEFQPLSLFCSLACEVSSFALPHASTMMGTINHGLETPKLGMKIKPFHL